MEDTWIREFYNETDPEARLEILNDHKLEDEIGLFMEKLWIARYGKRKPKKDLFMGYLMQIKSLSERNAMDIGGSKKKELYEIINGLYLFNACERSTKEKKILFLEMKNVFLKFIETSKNGRGFTSAVFGLGQLSDEGVAKKIAEQISAIAFYTPHMFHLDREFEIFQNAALSAYREKYPNREHFLTK